MRGWAGAASGRAGRKGGIGGKAWVAVAGEREVIQEV